MQAGWVDRVWEVSCRQTVAATDPQFADLTCAPFQGLFICVSQISRRDKEAIRRLIEGNGTTCLLTEWLLRHTCLSFYPLRILPL